MKGRVVGAEEEQHHGAEEAVMATGCHEHEGMFL
jgi:hypothetical protein